MVMPLVNWSHIADYFKENSMPKMPVRVYEVTWNKLLSDNWPAPEQVFICKDIQNVGMWGVARMGPPGEDLTRYGLFWEYDHAILFANVINEEV